MKRPLIIIFLLAIMWGTSAFSMEDVFNHKNIEHCLFFNFYLNKSRGLEIQDRSPRHEELVSHLSDFFFNEQNFHKAAQGIFDEIIFHIEDWNERTVFLGRIFQSIINSPEYAHHIKAENVYSRVWTMLSAHLKSDSGWTKREEPMLEQDKLPLFRDLKVL